MDMTEITWQVHERDIQKGGRETNSLRLLLPAIALSLLLHGTLMAVLVKGVNKPLVVSSPTTVRINILPSNPLTSVLPVSAVESVEKVDDASVDRVIEDNAVPQSAQSAQSATDSNTNEPAPDRAVATELPVKLADSPEINAPESNEPPQVSAPRVTVPSIATLQQTIKTVNAESAARSWLYDCNKLDEDSGVRTCDRHASIDYQQVERNAYYEALNPVRRVSPGERSAAVIYQNTAAISGALDNAAIAPELASYMREQLQLETSAHSDNGTGSVQHMRRMVERSAAAQQAARVLGDGWVRNQARKLQQRKVQPDP